MEQEAGDLFATTDPAALVRAIEQAANRLRRENLAAPEATALARSVVSHVRHARATVRQAVAEAARHLPEDEFEAAIGVLLRDRSEWVKGAATRSYDERSRRCREVRVQEESSADMRALRARIAADFSESAARASARLGDLALAQFVDRLHHELVKVAQPLRVAMDDVRTEARRVSSDRLAARADEAFAMLDVLIGIVDSAGAHAKLAEPSFREESLAAVVEEHVGLLRARIGKPRAARLRLETAVTAGLTADMDRGLFGQALGNLLQNAVEAYPADGDIHVRVTGEKQKAGTLVALTVADRGRGIRESEVPSIGEAFVSSKGRGRGLGVLNVKKMIEGAHGGRVVIESDVGVGTRVSIVVPRKQ